MVSPLFLCQLSLVFSKATPLVHYFLRFLPLVLVLIFKKLILNADGAIFHSSVCFLSNEIEDVASFCKGLDRIAFCCQFWGMEFNSVETDSMIIGISHILIQFIFHCTHQKGQLMTWLVCICWEWFWLKLIF